MFPETHVRAHFWYFVFARAIDSRGYTGDERSVERVLDQIESDYCYERAAFDDAGSFPYDNLVTKDWPQVYETVQEALVAFLIHAVARNWFRYSYEVWLRAVTLIVADAARRPDEFLRLTVYYPEDQPPGKRREVAQHPVMTLSDDWSCLSRDTFEAINDAYRGAELSDPPEADS